MRNAWYIAARSDEVSFQPLSKTILGTELVFVRTTKGVVSAFLNQCPHRGARLSDGMMVNDCLCCPFHGWHFDSEGTCKYIPANGPSAKIPARTSLHSFPVLEKANFIWVNLGDVSHSEAIPFIPEVEDPDWRAVPFQVTWNAHYSRVIESILDVSHLPFVHKQTTGDDVDPTVEGPAFDVHDQTILIYAKSYQKDQQKNNTSTITFHFPNLIILRTKMHEDQSMATYLSFTPIDDEHTTIYGLALRNFLHDLEFIDDYHYEHNMNVLEEDRPVVEGLRPRMSPLDLQKEAHVRSDGPQVRYRIMLRKALKAEHAEEVNKGANL